MHHGRRDQDVLPRPQAERHQRRFDLRPDVVGRQQLTTKTNSRGFYQFDFLPPGTYSLIQKQPKGYRDGKESLGSLGGKVGKDRFDRIVLREGDVGSGYNFGELLTVLARHQAKSKTRKK